MSINPKTTAAIGDHPLHPMLIHSRRMPSRRADRRSRLHRNRRWFLGESRDLAGRRRHCHGAGCCRGGLYRFLQLARIRRLNDAWYHMAGNLVAVVLALVNFYLRYAQGTEAAVTPWGVVRSSLIVVGILLFTGWKGWEMVYRHHVAVLDAPGQTSSEPGQSASWRPEPTPRRLGPSVALRANSLAQAESIEPAARRDRDRQNEERKVAGQDHEPSSASANETARPSARERPGDGGRR